jgi:leucyl aminopeptidase
VKIKLTSTLNHLFDQSRCLIIPFSSNDDVDKVLSKIGLPTDLISSIADDFSGEVDEWLPIYHHGKKIYLIGIGSVSSYPSFQKAFRSLHTKNRKLNLAAAGFYLLHLDFSKHNLLCIEGAVNGFIQGTYNIALYKTNDQSKTYDHESLDIIIGSTFKKKDVLQKHVTRARHTAETQLKIFDLVNAPSNKKKPADLADFADQSGKTYGYKVTIFGQKEIKKAGLHGLIAVNRGSEYPARFIITEYIAKNQGGPTIALVGKGVTFDTGGISIKRSQNMHYMKSDMGGAAAVLGTMELVAREKPGARVIGIIPVTDNSVDARAIKPGDVIRSYSGKTIEVINTDAEGRLILADGLAYAVKQFEPDYIIDLATLTGNVISALGNHAAGLYTHSDVMSDILESSGNRVGERLWRLPVWDVYAEDLKSDIADIRNLGDKPHGGSIAAAKFLEKFVSGHPHWAHLDIAGVAFKPNTYSKGYSATGFGIRLLLEFINALADQQTKS